MCLLLLDLLAHCQNIKWTSNEIYILLLFTLMFYSIFRKYYKRPRLVPLNGGEKKVKLDLLSFSSYDCIYQYCLLLRWSRT